MTNSIIDALGLNPMDDNKEAKTQIVRRSDAEIVEDKKSTELSQVEERGSEDYQATKENIRNLIELGNHSITELYQIALSSQDHKDYEALTKMMKTLLDANKDILEVENMDLNIKARKKKERMNVDEDNEGKSVTHNTIVFTGTTEDMLKQIEQLKKK